MLVESMRSHPKLCDKAPQFKQAFSLPQAYRTLTLSRLDGGFGGDNASLGGYSYEIFNLSLIRFHSSPHHGYELCVEAQEFHLYPQSPITSNTSGLLL
ncbi:MAG: hypothetical protein WCR46_03065 [Deltaproteobacteria bacterium]